jgi:hypothetical protein
MIAFRCPTCSQSLQVSNDLAGRPSRCPHCQEVIRTPKILAAAGVSDPGHNTAPHFAVRLLLRCLGELGRLLLSCLGVTAIIGVMCLTIWACLSPRSPRSPTAGEIREGQMCVVRSADGKPVPVAIDWFSVEKLREAYVEDDTRGQLRLADRLFMVEPGTRVRVLELRSIVSGSRMAKVEIFGGERNSGVIATACLMAEK